MVNIRIEKGKKIYNVDLPQSWDEVPDHLYPALARVYLRGPEFMNENDKLVRTLAILMDDALGVFLTLSDDQVFDLIQLVYWVYEELNLTENKIMGFDFEGVYYIGPASELSNLRFGEFVMAETYFMQYNDSERKNDDLLNKLIAVLYRPLGIGSEYEPGSPIYRGDRRERFNSNLTDDRAEKFKALDLAVKDGILLYYASARDMLFKYFRNVFSKRKSRAKKQKDGIDFGWMGVFDDLLGEKGRTAESLEEEFLSTVLMSLERGQIKYRELRRKN